MTVNNDEVRHPSGADQRRSLRRMAGWIAVEDAGWIAVEDAGWIAVEESTGTARGASSRGRLPRPWAGTGRRH
jgi:hypothetical protein